MKILFLAVAAALVAFNANPALALICGTAWAMLLGNPWAEEAKIWSTRTLQWAVIGLGGGVNLAVIGRVGLAGIGYTVVGITLTMLAGFSLGKFFKVERDSSLLISAGTAICGGSAIAALSSVINARAEQITVSLAAIFLLNALALILFPWFGHQFSLTETQFGFWCALAIHDTSSVVGASLQFGPTALETATTLKLARALWIIPLAAGVAFSRAQGLEWRKVKKPWFILGFLSVAAMITFFPALQPAGEVLALAAKRLLLLTLFLIGSGLSVNAVRAMGVKPLAQAVMLWLLVSAGSLVAITQGWVG